MHRFFVVENRIDQSKHKAYIKCEDAAHILRVLRLKAAEDLVLCDGWTRGHFGSDRDRRLFRRYSFLCSGNRTLRTETAGMAVLAIALYGIEG